MRKKDYKKSADATESRRKREEHTFSIRKNQRDENLQKRRVIEPTPTPQLNQELLQQLANLPQFCADVFSSDPKKQFDGTVGLRKVLSIRTLKQS